MYIFEFEKASSKNDIIKVSEVERTLTDFGDKISVELKPNGGIFHTCSLVPKEEGIVASRKFWLEDLDYDRASDIIDAYRKEKVTKRFRTNRTRKYKEVEA